MELVTGKLVDEAFSMLYDMVKQNLEFDKVLTALESKLSSIEPLIEEIRETNPMLKGLKDIIKEMEAGKKLIQKCSKPRPCSGFFRNPGYADKLHSLNNSLDGLLRILNLYGTNYQTAQLLKLGEYSILTKINDWQCPLPRLPSYIVGLDKPLGELKDKLFRSTGKSVKSLVVMTAPGGCGKTTLATMLCHDADVKEKYKKNIFFVPVLENPKLDHIVEQLFRNQGFQYSAPTKEDEAFTDTWLRRFLDAQEQDSLLVLDGVWLGWESSKLLDKFHELQKPNCKILVTSRFDFPKFGSSFYLKSLKDEDAKDLFHHSASLGDKSAHISVELSRKVLKCCKGLPFAITIVGGSLCGKSSEIWDTVTKGSVLKFQTVVHNRLEKSLKALGTNNPTMEKCFLDLAAFPEDQIISAAALIDIWTELYDDLHDDSMCIANLHELKDSTLANLVFPRDNKADAYGYYSEHFVTQHEMLRELAIYQTSLDQIGQRERLIMDISGDKFPKGWKQQMCQPLQAHLLSISTDRASSTKWHNVQLPKVEVVVLNLRTNKYALPQFMEQTYQLKVLIVTYYGVQSTADLSNFHLLGSLSSLKRIRLERISIASITHSSFQLKNLVKMSLFMCNIGEACSNSSLKFSEAFPVLEEMNIDNCNDLVKLLANLFDLTLLKKLSITNCQKLSVLPEEIESLINLEELRLLACRKLSRLPDSVAKLEKLELLDVSGCLRMVLLPKDIGKMQNLEILIRRECPNLPELLGSTSFSIISC